MNELSFTPNNTLITEQEIGSPSPVKSNTSDVIIVADKLDVPTDGTVVRRSGRERKPPERLDL